jgi:hypothetical protein
MFENEIIENFDIESDDDIYNEEDENINLDLHRP